MKIVFMGTPEFAVPILKGLNEKYEIALVVSQPNRAKKKGSIIPTPVALAASELGLELFQPQSIKNDYEKIILSDADVLVTAAYGQYVPSKILKKFKKCINVHGSLLPFHRGGAPIQRAIMNGDEYTGITIMEMSKRLDAGVMYAKKEYKIASDDNAKTVFDKLSIIGKNLLLEVIEDIYNGINIGIPQDDSIATYSPNIMPDEEIIDITKDAVTIFNQVRGLAMDPGAYLVVNDIKLKVFKASIVKCDEYEAGYVIESKKQIVIKTGKDAISLDLVLYPGKKMLSGRDFSNGQKLFIKGESII